VTKLPTTTQRKGDERKTCTHLRVFTVVFKEKLGGHVLNRARVAAAATQTDALHHLTFACGRNVSFTSRQQGLTNGKTWSQSTITRLLVIRANNIELSQHCIRFPVQIRIIATRGEE
jgi:hypothetical protein